MVTPCVKVRTSILKYPMLPDSRVTYHAGVIENFDGPSTVCHAQVVCLEPARLVREFEETDKSDEWVHHGQ